MHEQKDIQRQRMHVKGINLLFNKQLKKVKVKKHDFKKKEIKKMKDQTKRR